MNEPTRPARFRLRMEDGSEIAVSSVEGLAQRLVRAEFQPDTPLYDASTDAWGPAGASQVIRFLVEEMWEDGVELPEAWHPGERSDAVESDQIDEPDDLGVAGISDADDDPLTLEFTLADLPDVGPDGDSDEDSGALEDPGQEADHEADPEHVPARSFESHPPVDPAPSETLDEFELETGGWILPPSSADPVDAEGTKVHTGPPEPDVRAGGPGSAGSNRFRLRSPFLFLLLAGVGGGILFWGTGWDARDAVAPASEVSAGGGFTAAHEPLVPPPDLEGALVRSEDLFRARMLVVSDSLRNALDLPAAPPPEWLSGYYLAHADEFPAIRDFWIGYQDWIDALREADGDRFQAFVRDGTETLDLDPEELQRLQLYLRARYNSGAEARQERYQRLRMTAERALELHEFLVDHEADLQYTPAVGPGLPRDPVLEVGATDSSVRSEMNARLDAFFLELDRARGGSAPSAVAMGELLFGSMGDL